MALKPWQTKPENDVACGQCGSVYEKTMQRFPMRDSDVVQLRSLWSPDGFSGTRHPRLHTS